MAILDVVAAKEKNGHCGPLAVPPWPPWRNFRIEATITKPHNNFSSLGNWIDRTKIIGLLGFGSYYVAENFGSHFFIT